MTLALDGVCVDLAGRRVVADVSMEPVETGWVGIVGANGSGKTTLLRALGGRLPFARGSVTLDGTPCAADRAFRSRWIGFAPDGGVLPPELTGLDALSLTALAAGEAPRHDELALLRSALGVEAFWRSRIGSYSAGMKQRLAIYLAFVAGQRRIILDEPFNWLDPVSAYDTRDALAAMANDGFLIVSALHDVGMLSGCCSQGYVFARGRIAMALSRTDLEQARLTPRHLEDEIVDRLRHDRRESCA